MSYTARVTVYNNSPSRGSLEEGSNGGPLNRFYTGVELADPGVELCH